jgi:hypothetical protein
MIYFQFIENDEDLLNALDEATKHEVKIRK